MVEAACEAEDFALQVLLGVIESLELLGRELLVEPKELDFGLVHINPQVALDRLAQLVGPQLDIAPVLVVPEVLVQLLEEVHHLLVAAGCRRPVLVLVVLEVLVQLRE